LTGLSERSHLLPGGVNLDTHIQDVTGVLAAENIQDAVLVGHTAMLNNQCRSGAIMVLVRLDMGAALLQGHWCGA
jgi:hypothetical protein